MKLHRLFISNYQQFEFLELDLSYPENHEKAFKPLEKICLIGKNGTGKSTILRIIKDFYRNPFNPSFVNEVNESQFGFEVEYNGEIFLLGKIAGIVQSANALEGDRVSFYHRTFIKIGAFPDYYSQVRKLFKTGDFEIYTKIAEQSMINQSSDEYKYAQTFFTLMSHNGNKNLVVFSPSEAYTNKSIGTSLNSITNLDNALKYFNQFPYYHELSLSFLEKLWDLIIYQVKKREKEQLEYFKKPENSNKSIGNAEIEFNKLYPDFLGYISGKWNIILEDAGVYFDYEQAKIPIQLNDNLIAFFKVKGSGQSIEYHLLSSGIKNLLFRIGYLHSLFYKRNIENAIVLIDEPEISLFPDLLMKIIDTYTSIFEEGQFFFSTHSPLVASQFDPAERIVLEFNENKKIGNHTGRAPEGDDPNDLLVHDFGLVNVLGKKALIALERYVELKGLIRAEEDKDIKGKMMCEFIEIGNKYRFGIANEKNN